jgi:hypothetical protein
MLSSWCHCRSDCRPLSLCSPPAPCTGSHTRAVRPEQSNPETETRAEKANHYTLTQRYLWIGVGLSLTDSGQFFNSKNNLLLWEVNLWYFCSNAVVYERRYTKKLNPQFDVDIRTNHCSDRAPHIQTHCSAIPQVSRIPNPLSDRIQIRVCPEQFPQTTHTGALDFKCPSSLGKPNFLSDAAVNRCPDRALHANTHLASGVPWSGRRTV